MRAFLPVLLVLGTLLGSGTALAQRRPQEFVTPRQMSQEELEHAKQRSKAPIDSYAKDLPVDTRPFPWRAVALMGLVMLVALPFGLRAYARTSRELASNKSFGAAKPEGE